MEKATDSGSVRNGEMNMKLKESLEKILEDAKTVADAPHTKSEKRDRILALCENTEDIIKDLSCMVCTSLKI